MELFLRQEIESRPLPINSRLPVSLSTFKFAVSLIFELMQQEGAALVSKKWLRVFPSSRRRCFGKALSQARGRFQITVRQVKVARLAGEYIHLQTHGLTQFRTRVTGLERYWEGLYFLCTSSRRQDSIASKCWSPAHCRPSNSQSHLISNSCKRKERRRVCSSLLGPSLRRQRRGVGAKGAVLDVGSSSTRCEAPLARARVKTSKHHPTGVSALCLKNNCATF